MGVSATECISAEEVKMCVDISPYSLTNVDPVQGELGMASRNVLFMCLRKKMRERYWIYTIGYTIL